MNYKKTKKSIRDLTGVVSIKLRNSRVVGGKDEFHIVFL